MPLQVDWTSTGHKARGLMEYHTIMEEERRARLAEEERNRPALEVRDLFCRRWELKGACSVEWLP